MVHRFFISLWYKSMGYRLSKLFQVVPLVFIWQHGCASLVKGWVQVFVGLKGGLQFCQWYVFKMWFVLFEI